MKRIWMLRAAGILCIITGVSIVVIAGIVVAINVGALIRPAPEGGYGVLLFIFFGAPLSILSIIVGTFTIVGGICALKRRIWGLALTGSIALVVFSGCGILLALTIFDARFSALFVGYGIAGILAIIFVVLGKGEFKAKALVSALYREESADAYYNRGLAYHEKGEAPDAVNDLEKCIGLSTDPKLTKAAQQALRKAKKSL